MNDALLKKIIAKVQTAKHFRNLDEDIIQEKVTELLQRDSKLKKSFEKKELNERSSEFERIVKYVKQSMHKSYGAFQENVKKREKLLEELQENIDNPEKSLDIHKKLLRTHKSTAERLPFYGKLYKDLFSSIGKPDIILDIGCGLNPLSLPFMDLDTIMYVASDFTEKDTNFITDYFSIIKKTQKGIFETLPLNLTKDYAKLRNIPSDFIFAWKLFDVLDTKTTEHIVKNANAQYLVASFATKTLGKKRMNFPRRAGFQKMLRRLNLEYETLSYENEIFYIIKVRH